MKFRHTLERKLNECNINVPGSRGNKNIEEGNKVPVQL
jgi:hypothetical protein